MATDELDKMEEEMNDAWAVLNLTVYALQDVLARTEVIEGQASMPDATYRLGGDDVNALWGVLEALRSTRARMLEQLERF